MVYRENFDDESPFHPDSSTPTDRSVKADDDSQLKSVTCEEIQEKTIESFLQMINEIKVRLNTLNNHKLNNEIQSSDCSFLFTKKSRYVNIYLFLFQDKNFTVITLVGKWIQYISKFWERKLPNEILDLYLQLFIKYL